VKEAERESIRGLRGEISGGNPHDSVMKDRPLLFKEEKKGANYKVHLRSSGGKKSEHTTGRRFVKKGLPKKIDCREEKGGRRKKGT